MFELTPKLKKQYIKTSCIRNSVAFIFACIAFLTTFGAPLYYYTGWPMWSIGLIFIPWLIFSRLAYNRWVVPLIWRHAIEITEEQFTSLHGKTYIPPPEKFKDIFEYQGENDIDWVLNYYNGMRIIRWGEKPPYIVRFRKEEDAVHFKLALV